MLPSTVLLVEDDPDNRFIFRTILEHGGHRVLEAPDGEVGVGLALSAHPDVILMDIALPRLDGWSAIRALKADPATSSIPIVALTAFAQSAARDQAFELGCAGYLPKPVALRLVVAEVGRILAGGAGAAPGPEVG
jgi:CheY-like chemotaxis protein